MRDLTLAAVLAGWVLLLGCSSEQSDAHSVPVADSSGRSALPGGLTDSEVTDFLLVVNELPSGKFPEFQPAGIPPVEQHQEPEAAVFAWREAYRLSCDPANLARSWHANTDLHTVLSRRGYTPREFADLVLRISLAVTAASLDGQIDFGAAHREVEQQIVEMSRAIHQLDVAPNPSLSPQERLHRREAMMHALQETTALAEFLRMLSEVPQGSRTIATSRRSDLRPYLPDNANDMAQFERILEMDAQIVPAANWQPQR